MQSGFRGIGFRVQIVLGDRAGDEHSHGGSFFALVENCFGGHGLYLFDEPESALSPKRQLATCSRIHDLIGEESQFIIAAHSPILTTCPDTWIYEFSKNGIGRGDHE